MEAKTPPVVWRVFGAANQLLAALTLLAATTWLLKIDRRIWYTPIPAIFITATTIVALVLLIEKTLDSRQWPIAGTAAVFFLLGLGSILLTRLFFLEGSKPSCADSLRNRVVFLQAVSFFLCGRHCDDTKTGD